MLPTHGGDETERGRAASARSQRCPPVLFTTTRPVSGGNNNYKHRDSHRYCVRRGVCRVIINGTILAAALRVVMVMFI